MTEQRETPQASSTSSEADADNDSPSVGPDEATLAGIGDEQLPEDLQPGEDNPLAEPLDPDDEATKDADELGMTDTQDDTTGQYRSEGEVDTSDTTSADSEDAPEDDDSAS
jgi:hypothetical protein